MSGVDRGKTVGKQSCRTIGRTLLSDTVRAYPSRPVLTLSVRTVRRNRPAISAASLIYTPVSQSFDCARRHNRLAAVPRDTAHPRRAELPEYRRVQPPVASISPGQTRSLRPENCLALSISISPVSCSARDVTKLPSSSSSPSRRRRLISVSQRPVLAKLLAAI